MCDVYSGHRIVRSRLESKTIRVKLTVMSLPALSETCQRHFNIMSRLDQLAKNLARLGKLKQPALPRLVLWRKSCPVQPWEAQLEFKSTTSGAGQNTSQYSALLFARYYTTTSPTQPYRVAAVCDLPPSFVLTIVYLVPLVPSRLLAADALSSITIL